MNKTRFGSIVMVGLLLLSLLLLDVPLTTGQTATPGPQEEPMVTVRLFNRTVRAFPYSRAEVLGVFPRRSTVPVTAITEDGRWWQVPYPTGPGGYAYIRTRWTRPNEAANNVPRIRVVFETPGPEPETPTLTPAPPAPTAVPCTYNSAFVADVTIPDNTLLPPAQAFQKVWRVMNTGTCTWGPGTVLVFIRGSAMNGQSGSPVPQALPGATVDIGLTLFAPSAPGRYTGVWRIMDPNGRLFGPELTVVIQVPSGAPPPPPPTPTATPLPARSVNFWADTYRVDPGQCTTVRWTVTGAQAVFLEFGGRSYGVPPNGSRRVCPSTDGKTYTLRVIWPDGSQTSRSLTININAPSATATPVPPTQVPPTQVPPTQVPPTKVPPTQVPPTPIPAPVIQFNASKTTTKPGECVTLSWNVQYAQSVEYSSASSGTRSVPGTASTFTGSSQECPTVPTTYNLKVVGLNGQVYNQSITITPVEPTATPVVYQPIATLPAAVEPVQPMEPAHLDQPVAP